MPSPAMSSPRAWRDYCSISEEDWSEIRGGHMSEHDILVDPLTRESFLRRAGVAGVAVLGGTLWRTAPAAARARRTAQVETPIEHLVIACQENRSFDHYFGYAPQVQAKGFGPPAGYTQPDAAGVGHAPFELTALRSSDPPHW